MSLWALAKNSLFLLSLAMAQRVRDLEAVSCVVGVRGNTLVLSFLP